MHAHARIQRSSAKWNKDKAEIPPLPESSENLNHRFQPLSFHPPLSRFVSFPWFLSRSRAEFLLGGRASSGERERENREKIRYRGGMTGKNVRAPVVDDNFSWIPYPSPRPIFLDRPRARTHAHARTERLHSSPIRGSLSWPLFAKVILYAYERTRP